MGWSVDLDDPLIDSLSPAASRVAADDVAQMATYWSVLYGELLSSESVYDGKVTVVSHGALARGGMAAAGRLFDHLGIVPSARTVSLMSAESSRSSPDVDVSKLHNLNRDPAVVSDAWRMSLNSDEIARIENACGEILRQLEAIAWKG